MITNKVVLVLGAGASEPYNFLTGLQLYKSALSITNDIRAASPPFRITPLSLDEFCNELRASRKKSIDAFVEHRNEYTDIGKFLIAYHLIKCEYVNGLYYSNENDDWYGYLYNTLMRCDSFEDFSRNKLSIITYNYDRSLEYYLFHALKSSYRKADEECKKILEYIPIIHLHGKLGDLPEFKGFGVGRGYNSNIDTTSLLTAINGIKIVHEKDNYKLDPEFIRAYDVLSCADVVVFLGFGYLPKNIERLHLDEHCKAFARFYGSAFY